MANGDTEKAGTGAGEQAAAPAPAAAAPAKPPEVVEEKYTRDVWKEHAKRRFGVSPHAVAGALYDIGPDDVLSEVEVRQRLAFLEKPLT
jgi:hypothetical protein